MKIVLISPYEIGRQPFGLAEPAAWLAREGCAVTCIDMAVDKLDPAQLAGADLIGIYVAMHTATRIAIEAIPKIRAHAPAARLCVYGLYAPMNEARLRALGVGTVLGGEIEPALTALVRDLREGRAGAQTMPVVHTDKIDFLVPRREGLPALARYAQLILPDDSRRIVGFAEGTRGCKHLCRHCPVVPVYEGKFRVVPVDVIMADIRQQVAMGAQHISFGDPDFLNGPTHATRLIEAFAREFPGMSFDATIKIEHLLKHADLLPRLRAAGCLFITSAVESVDDAVLDNLLKHHTRADFLRAVALMRATGIALAPTFVPFSPWTTLESYLALLNDLVALQLVESVPPVQLVIRLLVPQGSHLLSLPAFAPYIGEFNEKILGYPWAHPDSRVDALQRELEAFAGAAESQGLPRREIFAEIWRRAHTAAGRAVPALPAELGNAIPRLSEPWYCCAEPTAEQLSGF
jgi:radical SAM superfamily enzyme YgiQ (UPF0313 family)